MRIGDKTHLKRYNSELTDEEKAQVMKSVFFNESDPEKYVKNPQKYLESQFQKLNGFDIRWTSLISSKPLLFEDVDYLRILPFIDNQITEDEKNAYKEGKCRELYATFENMLVCNLKYYNRIISFCTMMFLHYVRIDDEVVSDNMDDMTLVMSMTPTEIWCAALASTSSSEWELQHGWNFYESDNLIVKPIEGSTKSPIELSWDSLYNNNLHFRRFVEFSALRCGTSGFRQTLISDVTSNSKLAQVCQKFTRASFAISEQQLSTLWDYIQEVDIQEKSLFITLSNCLKEMFGGDESQYAVYVYYNEFYIHTSKFSMRVKRDKNGNLSKDYLANSFECFTAEKYLIETISEQIKWAKYEIQSLHKYDREILTSLLSTMLTKDYHDVICIKRMNDYGILSKITFTGVFSNVYLKEEFMFNNRVIKTQNKCLSKQNAAQYIVERGYYLFGRNDDIYKFMVSENITQDNIIDHYTNYSVPIMQHMFDVIAQNELYKNEIIDIVMVDGNIDEKRFNNRAIKYTSLIQAETKDIMNDIIVSQRKNLNENKKSYWRVIND